jgi:hypothetical protein
MYQVSRLVVTALCVLIVAGCATSSPIVAKPEAVARIQSTRAHIVVPQEEINVFVPHGSAAGAGAAGAGLVGLGVGLIIDASVEAKRADKANRLIERSQLGDFDFRSEFNKKFRSSLNDLSALKIEQAEVASEAYSADIHKHLLTTMSQDSLLVMAIGYQLSVDYRSLVVNGTATLWQRGQEEAQYLGKYSYYSAPISSKSGETAVKAWAENKAEALRAALREGIGETIRMLQLDFVSGTTAQETDGSLGEDGKLRVVSIKAPAGHQKGGVTTSKVNELASKILAKNGDRIIFRSKLTPDMWKGNRYTIPGHIYSTTSLKRFDVQVATTLNKDKPRDAAVNP